jgi:hypothetical protein
MRVAGWSGALLNREQELSELKVRLSPVFGRAGPRRGRARPAGNWRDRRDIGWQVGQ